MNDADGWIYFDGPEPERIRPLLDALRDLPPATPEDKERVARQFFAKLDAALSRREEPAGGEEGPGSARPGAPIAPPGAERREAEDGATVRSPTRSDRIDASPKEEPSALEAPLKARGPRAEDTGAAPEAPGEGATEVLASTELAPDLPAEVWKMLGRLPFRPASLEQAAARTLQVPVMTRNLGDTAPVADDAMAKAVAALPFVGNTVGAGSVPFPRLKLAEYASLHAELLVWPERAGEILPRYHVPSKAARKALRARRWRSTGRCGSRRTWGSGRRLRGRWRSIRRGCGGGGVERGGGADRASNDADVSTTSPEIPYGEFSPVRLQDLLAFLANPTRPYGRADGDVYFQASDGSVTLPAAGYDYGDNWAIFTGGTFTHWNGS
ncbi:hypothetical protein ACMHYB_45165 [Sorangium sp. So ce1128]